MALTDEDVREILRLIDESELDELRIETAEFKLHVVRGAAAAAPEPEAAPPASDGAAPAGTQTIDAPMPGTFYRAEGPGMAPFVEVGARVEPDTVVCLIEIMKMMNSVQAGVAGTIVEVCAEDAEVVGDGATLFRVEAA
ncbi:MAG: acetyl-CoA carboxylase biotin carboxyl carrier protein [Thermoleophilaceae bacterium]|jgi:biotin carboxyl carrier protein|nr:acetyl-CoA carboxylase biotin carboxyl carrier protein [Thermoleophilaceae bacterium]